MAKAIKTIVKTVLLAPLWIVGWVLLGVLYIDGWIIDFIEGEEA